MTENIDDEEYFQPPGLHQSHAASLTGSHVLPPTITKVHIPDKKSQTLPKTPPMTKEARD
jgi:hypothetical protein